MHSEGHHSTAAVGRHHRPNNGVHGSFSIYVRQDDTGRFAFIRSRAASRRIVCTLPSKCISKTALNACLPPSQLQKLYIREGGAPFQKVTYIRWNICHLSISHRRVFPFHDKVHCHPPYMRHEGRHLFRGQEIAISKRRRSSPAEEPLSPNSLEDSIAHRRRP